MIKEIDRTSIASWSPAKEQEPLLALGTVAGALDASFSSKTELEIFSLDLASPSKSLQKLGGIPCNARFNRISWGNDFIACGKENGELDLWDPKKILQGDEKPLVLRTSNHSGPVRGLHFNPKDTHLLASGATDGEIFIWDMNQLSKPYSPGARSQRLEDVTCLAWNREVPHILASGSTNGYTVVWDLRNRKELIKIPYPGGRKPVTSIAWNPDKPTQMVTCSDDDSNPVILVWDLRNASAAERTLSGHSKGILSMDWCPKDSDLLLSCGKDNRTIVWNTTVGEPIGDLVHSGNWSFDVKWCPRNPDLCVVASYDGKVSVHSIQGSSDHPDDDAFTAVPKQVVPEFDPNDPFSGVGQQDHHQPPIQQPVFTLPQPPKWLRKPIGAVWGFGGQLIMFDVGHSNHVTIKSIPVSEEVSFRSEQLDYILKENNPETTAQYCDYMAQSEFVHDQKEKDIWKFLKTLFSSNSRDDMIDFLGFDASFANNERLSALLKKLTVSLEPRKNELPVPLEKEQNEVDKISGREQLGAFSVYTNRPGEDADIDILITKALIIGDFGLAVKICIGSNRIADAFMFAVNGGPELLQYTQEEFFKMHSKTRTYARLLQSIVEGDLTDIVNNANLTDKEHWKDVIALICTYSKPEDYAYYFSVLANRLQGSASTKEIQHASALCFIGSGEFEKVAQCWTLQEKQPVHVENTNLLGLIERLSILRQGIRFQDPSLAIDHTEEFSLGNIYNLYVEYAWIAASNGKVEVAWRFLELVPIDFIPTVSLPVDIFVLRDRIYSSRDFKLSVTGRPPAFPFEIVDVIDFEAKQRAEKLRQEQLNRQAQAAKPQAPYNPYQSQPAQAYGGYENQPSGYGQQWQQPPLPTPPMNQWSQPPQNWNSQPVMNSWNQNQPMTSNQGWNTMNAMPVAPPPVQQFVPPPINQGWNPSVATPPVTQQPFIPPPPQGRSTATSSGTGHAPPIPATFQPPTYNPPHQATTSSFERKKSFVSNPMSPPPIPAQAPPKPDPLATMNPIEKQCYNGLVNLWKKLESETTSLQDKKNAEEGEKKAQLLYDQLGAHQVPTPIIEELLQIIKALQVSDFATAQKVEHDMMINKFDTVGSWIVSIKKLVDGLERNANPRVAAPTILQPNAPALQTSVPPPPLSKSTLQVPPPTGPFIPTMTPAPPLNSNPPMKPHMGPPPTTGFQGTTPAPPVESQSPPFVATPFVPPVINQVPGFQQPPPVINQAPGFQQPPPPVTKQTPGFQQPPPPVINQVPGFQQPQPPVTKQTPGFQQPPPTAGLTPPPIMNPTNPYVVQRPPQLPQPRPGNVMGQRPPQQRPPQPSQPPQRPPGHTSPQRPQSFPRPPPSSGPYGY